MEAHPHRIPAGTRKSTPHRGQNPAGRLTSQSHKEIVMRVSTSAHRLVVGMALVLATGGLTPFIASAEDHVLAIGPVPSWDETSGYSAVETIRAGQTRLIDIPSWDETSGYGAVEANRATMDLSAAS
jgi:hypothetical protein